MKRAVIVHGWSGYPEEAWFPWLKRELEVRGWQVAVPTMPDADYPKIGPWVSQLAETVGEPDTETYLIGHSIGVQTILRYLQAASAPVGGVVAVAGWLALIPGSLEKEEEETAVPWLATPIDFERVKKNCGRVAAIFSDNDRFVDLENVDMFKEKLNANVTILSNAGHIGGPDGTLEVPEILKTILSISEPV